MIRLLAGVLAALFMLCLVAPTATALSPPAVPRPPPIDPLRLDAFLDRVMALGLVKAHTPGAVVAVVQHGRIIALRGYGYDRLQPQRRLVDPRRTLFLLGSTTKIFTWIALMQAVENGRVDLSRPVDDDLPPNLRTASPRFRTPIRVEDLMGHTAGFEDNDIEVSNPPDPDRIRSLDEYLRTSRPRRTHEAGTTPSYSNYAVNLAARIALAGSGAADFPSLIERDITGPLGMASTTLREPHPPQPGAPAPMPEALAAAHTDNFFWNGAEIETRPFHHMVDAPASAMSSTGFDMARLMLAMLAGGELDGRRIYGPSVAAAFTLPLLPGGQTNRWAHGLMMYALPGDWAGVGHDGGIPYAVSKVTLVPALDLGIFVAANSKEAGSLVYDLSNQVVRAFCSRPDDYSPGHPRPAPEDSGREARAVTGDYLTTRRPYEGLAEMVGTEPITVSVDAQGYLHAPAGGRYRRWVPAGEPGVFVDAEGYERIAFRLDDGGRGVSWVDPNATRTYERIGWLESLQAFMILVAGLLVASVGVLLAALVRLVRGRPSPRRRFDHALVAAGGLFIATAALMAATAAGSDDPATLAHGFPSPLLRSASVLSVLATILTVGVLLALPRLWRGRVGWFGPTWRSVAILLMAAFALRWATMGGLAFWS